MRRKAFLLFVLTTGLVLVSSCNAQNRKMKSTGNTLQNRSSVVAGTFYPADPAGLAGMLSALFDEAPVVEKEGTPLAVISPHAGYIYSARVAAAGYRQLPRDATYDHIFLIGPSHYVGFGAASIYDVGNYETPLGEVSVDINLAQQLIRENSCFVFNREAHDNEHAIEVQLPFLQYWLQKPFKIIPVIIGTQDPSVIRKIAGALQPYLHSGNLFIISSDMSHYPAYHDAKEADRRTLNAILSNDPVAFSRAIQNNSDLGYNNLVTSMCGWPAVLALLDMTKDMPRIHYREILYMNSGDVPQGDQNRVVGYGSVIVTKQDEMKEEFLSEKDKTILLKLARRVLNERIVDGESPTVNGAEYPESLHKVAGAFVTLTEKGRLRGCIGRFRADQPLYEVIRDMTVAAALNDPRFSPVQSKEVKNIDIEISVLTPLKKISSADEFTLGKQGIFMVKNGRSGTFLPQVAQGTGWTKEEFLGHCARDKAGIGWDGWKDADLYTYEAIVFSEKEPGLR